MAERRAASGGKARMITFRDRILGAQPVLSYRGVADPTVAKYPGGWVAISTGPAAPRAIAPQPGGPWQNIPSALTVLPSWAISGRIWASDLVLVDGVWILYFTAEVAGLGLDGRCVGTATAADPTQTFVPDERPLVCPRQAARPRGVRQDQAAQPGPAQGRGDRPRLLPGQGRQPLPALPHPGHALHDPDRPAARPAAGPRGRRGAPSWSGAAA